ncbi:TPA: hypothetical protein HNO33_26960 [Escherichia coli]|nr:hypothetical protein [Escherichia coli]
MSIVLFLATADNYFRTGVSNLPLLQNNDYKIFDFYNIIDPMKSLLYIIKIISDLNNAGKLILYLYVIQGMKIEDIERITYLSVKTIYYRIRTIKSKFGVNTTQKLSILFKDCFLSY